MPTSTSEVRAVLDQRSTYGVRAGLPGCHLTVVVTPGQSGLDADGPIDEGDPRAASGVGACWRRWVGREVPTVFDDRTLQRQVPTGHRAVREAVADVERLNSNVHRQSPLLWRG